MPDLQERYGEDFPDIVEAMEGLNEVTHALYNRDFEKARKICVHRVYTMGKRVRMLMNIVRHQRKLLEENDIIEAEGFYP